MSDDLSAWAQAMRDDVSSGRMAERIAAQTPISELAAAWRLGGVEAMAERTERCRHIWDKWHWKEIGPAPEFRGQPCILWRCELCGAERELFAGIDPSDR